MSTRSSSLKGLRKILAKTHIKLANQIKFFKPPLRYRHHILLGNLSKQRWHLGNKETEDLPWEDSGSWTEYIAHVSIFPQHTVLSLVRYHACYFHTEILYLHVSLPTPPLNCKPFQAKEDK